MFKTQIVTIISCVFIFIVFCGCGAKKKDDVQQHLENLSDDSWKRVDSILARIQPPNISERSFSVIDFGASPNDDVTDKFAFDSCLSACTKSGGGIVSVPSGRYLMDGPVHLENNIHLKFDSGVYILFSENPDDYLPVVLTSWEGTRLYNYSPLIYARNKKNIMITGDAVLDGNAKETWGTWKKDQRDDQVLSRKMNHEDIPLQERIFGKGHKLRAHFMQFYECENVTVQGITLTNSPFWCIHPVFSKNVIVRNVTFDARNLNNDGIDPESSAFVLIENITFSNRDDNVAIKAGRDHEARALKRSSRNIIVRNCRFQGHNALAIGSEMSGGVNNIFVENCSFAGSVVKGIYLKSNKDRGGAIHDVFVRNVDFGESSTVIEIDSDYKNEGAGFPPSFYNIVIENITCREATHYGIYMKGSEEVPVKDVMLKDVAIEKAKNNLYLENAERIVFENVRIENEMVKPEMNMPE